MVVSSDPAVIRGVHRCLGDLIFERFVFSLKFQTVPGLKVVLLTRV